MGISDEEILSLWKSLNECGVRYIMVGGFAMNLHGYSRFTADIDLWIKDSRENRKKLRQALHQMELGDYEALETTQLIQGWTSIL